MWHQLKDTQRWFASCWRLVKSIQYPKTGGGTRRWRKRCTSATMTSSPSCSNTTINTVLLPVLTTRRAWRRAWTACCKRVGALKVSPQQRTVFWSNFVH